MSDCPLHGLSCRPIRNLTALEPLDVAVICEAPGEDEAIQRLPLVGRSGQHFDRMVSRTIDARTGQPFRREQFHLGNVGLCRPPENELAGASYERAYVEHWRPALEAQLQAWKPRAILAAGLTAARWFIPEIDQDPSRKDRLKNWRGYVIETKWGTVIPTYHPAFLVRGQFALSEVFQFDLAKAVDIARNGVRRKPVTYILRPSIQDAWDFEKRYRSKDWGPLAFDIENPMSAKKDEEEFLEHTEDDPSYTILRISFSFEEHTAITMPWEGPYIDVARALLASPGTKLVWNAPHDVPRLEADGSPINGTIIDSMEAWHRLKPHLPRGLKYAATFCTDLPQWKHQSSAEPEWYSAVDSDALLRVHNWVWQQLAAVGQLDQFQRLVVAPMQILRGMSRRGILVDGARREATQKDLQARFAREVSALQPLIPLDLRPRKAYKISRERLEKKFGSLREDEWLATEEPMTAKEAERALRAAQRTARSAERALAKKLRTSSPAVGKRTRKKKGETSSELSSALPSMPSSS